MILRIAHLSDPHFGTVLPGVKEALLESLRELNPNLVLLTGDITQRATRSQFKAAKHFTHEINPIPVIAVPGNHDIPLYNIFGRIFNPYWRFKKLFKDQLEREHLFGDVLVSGLNTTSKWRHIQGQFDQNRLEKYLALKQKTAKIHIAAFHHPMDCSKPQDEKNLLVDRDESIQKFDQYGIDLIIGGHIHDPYVTLSKVRYPHTKRSMIIGVAGTCLSWRTRKDAPNSFNLIEIETMDIPKMKITRYDQRPDMKFTVEKIHQFIRPNASGWAVVD